LLYSTAFGAALLVALAYLAFVMLAASTIVDPRDAAALASAPLLATASRISAAQLRSLSPGDRHPANYPIENPASPFADAMRVALVQLMQAKADKVSCIAVAGAQLGDGASTISLALARTAAAAGVRVLLIDTDFAEAGLTKAMGIEPVTGIEAILGGGHKLADLVVEDHMTSVHLLPSAPRESSHGALSLTQLAAIKAMLAAARVNYDMILIDCQPHGPRARTRSMARLADAVLLVASYDTTKRNAMRAFARRMQHYGVVVCGVVFNCIPFRSRREHVRFSAQQTEFEAATFPPHLEAIPPAIAESRSLH
jgi:Mrp family chromosome partitioning ATPase